MYHVIKIGMEKGLHTLPQRENSIVTKFVFLDQSNDMFDLVSAATVYDTVPNGDTKKTNFIFQLSVLIAASIFAFMIIGIRVVEKKKKTSNLINIPRGKKNKKKKKQISFC
uniref:Uncharacterized protein n=1 Tax=Corethron hystrix TaxID=216773 RepID=A0A7S1BJW9_9STRA|mmetsp:Transcript_29520/g.67876  ORF Transcript_29520/g.67876 Transcript_29520/m.67876 type:complete len:111 (+) Transcript_29520:701-1033(+)